MYFGKKIKKLIYLGLCLCMVVSASNLHVLAQQTNTKRNTFESTSSVGSTLYPGYANLAYQKTVETSTSNPNYLGSNAVDGNFETRWASVDAPAESFFIIDFKEATTFNRVCINQEYPDRIKNVIISILNEDQTWQQIDVAGTSQNKKTQALYTTYLKNSVTSTKLKFDFVKMDSGASNGITLKELQVYNIPEEAEYVTYNYNKELDDYHQLTAKINSDTPMNWVFAGDSLTQANQFTESFKRYSELFEQYIKLEGLPTAQGNKKRSLDYVENTAVAGATTNEFDAEQEMRLLHPDVVFLAFGMNDVGFPDNSNIAAGTPEKYKASLKQMIKDIREEGAIPILQTSNIIRFGYSDKRDLNLAEYMKQVKLLAQEENVIVIDNYDYWQMNNVYSNGEVVTSWVSDIAGNKIHPSTYGQLRWAQTLLGSLGFLDKESTLAQATSDVFKEKTAGAYIDPYQMYLSSDDIKAPTDDPLVSLDINKYFDGTAVLDQSKNAAELDIQKGSIVVKFKAGKAPDERQRNFISISNENGNDAMQFGLTSTGKLRYSLQDTLLVSNASDFDDNLWHTAVIASSGSAIHMYLDGKQIAYTAVSSSFLSSIEDLKNVSIGGLKTLSDPSGTNMFCGSIDYINIYDSKKDGSNYVYENNIEKVKERILPIINNTTPNHWLVIGGNTTLGLQEDVTFQKSYLQSFEEVLRWEVAKNENVERAKFIENHSRDGLTMAEINDHYDTYINRFHPEVVMIMPDILSSTGTLVENDVASFGESLVSTITKAKNAKSKIVLMSPPSANAEIAPYIQKMREIAKSEDIIYINVYEDLQSALQQNTQMKTTWFDENGNAKIEAHNYTAKKMCMTLLPATTTRAFPLDSALRTLTYMDKSEKELEHSSLAPRVKVEGIFATIDLSEIQKNSPYVFSSIEIWENHKESKKLINTISDEQKIEKVLFENGNYTYDIIGNVADQQGNKLKTITFSPASVDIQMEARDALQKAVDKYGELAEEQYLAKSWAIFETALNNAKSALSSEGKYSLLLEELITAVDNLVDISRINDAIAVANIFDQYESRYSKDSWAAYTTALNNVEALVNKEDLTKDEMIETINILNQKKKQLVWKAPVNLVSSATITVNIETTGHEGSKAIDGNTSTWWYAQNTDAIATIMFSKPALVSKIRIAGAPAENITTNADGYEVYAIDENGTVSTTPLVSASGLETGNGLGFSDVTRNDFKSVYVSGLKFVVKDQNTGQAGAGNGVNVGDFEAWGLEETSEDLADKSELANVINVGTQRVKNKKSYTAESYTTFKEVYDEATSLFQDPEAKQTDVNSIRRSLIDNIYELTKLESIPHQIRVAAIGDSITYGYMDGNEAETAKYNFPLQLQNLIGNNYQVKNFGVSGATMLSKGNLPYINQPKYDQSLTYAPDVVLIMLGTNDTKPVNMKYSSEFEKNATDLIDSYKLLESQPIIYLNTSPTIFHEGMATGGENAITEAVLVNDILPLQKKIASDTKVKSIDIHFLTKDQASGFPDNVHGNKDGYAYLANAIKEHGIDIDLEIKKQEFSAYLYGKNQIIDANYSSDSWEAFKNKRDQTNSLAVEEMNAADINTALAELNTSFEALKYQKAATYANEKIKIAAVGDSLTQGYNGSLGDGAFDDPSSDRYPVYLQKNLGNNYLVRNFGRNGKTVRDTPESYVTSDAFNLSKEFEPDVVIIMLGTNDAKQEREGLSGPTFPNYWPLTLTDDVRIDYKQRLEELIRVYQKLDTQPIVLLASSPTVRYKHPAYNIWPEVVNNDIANLQRQVANETGIKFIDVNQLTAHTLGQNLDDGIHGNFVEISEHIQDGLTADADVQKLVLCKLIAEYSELAENEYTEADWAKLQNALNDAKSKAATVLNLEQVQNVIKELKEVKNAMREEVGPNVNMALLKNGATGISNSEKTGFPLTNALNEDYQEDDRWITNAKASDVTFEITMREVISLKKITVKESHAKDEWRPSRINKISIEISEDGIHYQKIYKGQSVGISFTKTILPTKVQSVRITVTPNEKGATDGIQFEQIGLYGEKVSELK